MFNTDVPGPPGKPAAEIKSKTEIRLTWTPPKSDGGSLVTGYSIEMYDIRSGKWVKDSKAQVCSEADFVQTIPNYTFIYPVVVSLLQPPRDFLASFKRSTQP